MKETSKSIPRRLRDISFARYFAGNGIDVGCGDDSIRNWQSVFPLMGSVRDWDLADGDAQALDGIEPSSFDWLHSSHCLEHLRNPLVALRRWCEVVRPGGHLVILVPDEDLYERGNWPSQFNADHKHTFTIHKRESWSPASCNVLDMCADVSTEAETVGLCILDATFRPEMNVDQSATSVAECAIEIIMRRRLGSLPPKASAAPWQASASVG